MKTKRSLVLISIAALAGSVVLAGLAPSSNEQAAWASAPAMTTGSLQAASSAESPKSLRELISTRPESAPRAEPTQQYDVFDVVPEPEPEVPVAVAVDSISEAKPLPDTKPVVVRIVRVHPAPAAPQPAAEAQDTVAIKPETWTETMLSELNLEEMLLKIETAQ